MEKAASVPAVKRLSVGHTHEHVDEDYFIALKCRLKSYVVNDVCSTTCREPYVVNPAGWLPVWPGHAMRRAKRVTIAISLPAASLSHALNRGNATYRFLPAIVPQSSVLEAVLLSCYGYL